VRPLVARRHRNGSVENVAGRGIVPAAAVPSASAADFHDNCGCRVPRLVTQPRCGRGLPIPKGGVRVNVGDKDLHSSDRSAREGKAQTAQAIQLAGRVVPAVPKMTAASDSCSTGGKIQCS